MEVFHPKNGQEAIDDEFVDAFMPGDAMNAVIVRELIVGFVTAKV